MGTRSTTQVMDEQGNHLVSLYRQFDGYPTGHGQELADFLSQRTIINGFGEHTADAFANGMGCLAAQLVAHLKTGIGNIYITRKGDVEQYNYTVTSKDGQLYLKCESSGELLFNGLASDFNGKTIEGMEDEDEDEDED